MGKKLHINQLWLSNKVNGNISLYNRIITHAANITSHLYQFRLIRAALVNTVITPVWEKERKFLLMVLLNS